MPIVILHREEKGFRLQHSLEDSTEKEVTTEVQKRDGQNGKESQKKEEEIQGATERSETSDRYNGSDRRSYGAHSSFYRGWPR